MKKYNELKTVAALVKAMLEKYPAARDNDMILYYRICENINFAALHKPFCDVLLNLHEYGYPPFESVRRARQKVQEHNPHLASSRAIMAAKADNEEAFRAFARGEAG